jgi:peptidyl-prolyl cis-trans isomerase SurA
MTRPLTASAVLVLAALLAAAPLAARGRSHGAGQAAGTQGQSQSKSVIIQRVIVKVNGEIFTQTDLEQRQIETLRDRNQQAATPLDLQNEAVLKTALADVTPDILAEAVDELLLVQRGRELGVTFTDENFRRAIDNIKAQNKLDDAGLKVALEQANLTLEALRTNFERTYLVQAVTQNEIMKGASLTDEEARQYYRAHQKDFLTPATVMLREVFVEVPTQTQGGQVGFLASVADLAEAKVAAARDRALKGEDFAKIAAEVSDSGTKANGGLIGPVLVSELSDTLRGLFEKMKPGDLTEPLRTPKGFQLFKLESRSDPQPEPFEKVRDQIGDLIYRQRAETETQKYLDKLRTQALIEWKDDVYRAQYEKAKASRQKIGG